MLRMLYQFSLLLGFDPRRTILTLRGLPYYLGNLIKIRHQKTSSSESFPFGRYFPCIGERFSQGGTAKGHYFHQDLLIARRIYENNPTVHLDIGSRLDGFIAHVASFREIEVMDIRPVDASVKNISFLQADAMSKDFPLQEYCDSLSCLHALEHFGLGRYGDPVDYNGHIAGLANLYKTLKPLGKLYFSVPIGPQRIEFDAHRVFSLSDLLKKFHGKYRVDQFSYVDDAGNLHEHIMLTQELIDNNCGCKYGCGIFELTKL